MLTDKAVLITGGTGSFGRAFVQTVLERYQPKKIIVYSRDELKQFEMQQVHPFTSGGPMRYFIGDIRDRERLRRAMHGVDVVVHAAALKQVVAAEYNPFEVIKTNVIGSQNVIDAAIDTGVQKVVALSTDKAASPINLYGATKLCSDKLFISANNHTGLNPTNFSVVRYGNVLGSRGSVVPVFKEQCNRAGIISITDERMTRFSITIREGVDFVLRCLEQMWGGELFVPKIPSYRIGDLAKAVAPDVPIQYIGIRPGEKLHEEMITATDSFSTLEFREKYVICPPEPTKWLTKDFQENSDPLGKGKKVVEGFSYISGANQKFLSVPELRMLIDKDLPDH